MPKVNEFGIRLDGAGYAPSIMEPTNACCALCGRRFGTKMDRHEPWGGLMNREKSKELGLWYTLCHWGCHEGPGSVHAEAEVNRELRRRVQAQAMIVYGWDFDEWRRRFGKSEIGEDEDLYAIGTIRRERAERRRSARESAPCAGGFRLVLDGPELPY